MDSNNVNNYNNGNGYNNNGAGNSGPNGSGNGGQGNNGQGPKKQGVLLFLIASLITLLLMSYFMKLLTGRTEEEISYNRFVSMVESGEIKRG